MSDVRRYVIVGNGFAGTTAAEQLRGHELSWNFERRQGLIAEELIAAALS